tara:strand:+ start:3622 stop:5910 length:2289 start_codon:yes stop_codon:yes gene_type:complete
MSSEESANIIQLAEMPYSGIREEKETDYKPKNRTLEVDSSPQLEKLEEEFKTLKEYNAYEGQLVCLSKILKIKGNNPSALFNKGTILLKLEKYEDAIDAFNEKMLSVTTDADTYYNKAIAHNELKQWDEAVYAAKKAREINPKLVDAWRLEGSALDDLEKYEDAIACFDKAIELEPNHAIAWRHKGITLTNGLEKHEEALECFDKAREIDPDEKKVYLNIANTYQEIRDFEKAISYFDKAIEKDPNWTAAIFDKAVTYEREIDDKEKADECFKQVIKIKKYARTDLYCKIYAFMELKKWDEALECCEERLSMTPITDADKRMYHNRQAYAFNELKKYEDAIACCNKSLEIKKNDWLAFLRKGFALGELERHEEAVKCYDEVIAIWKNEIKDSPNVVTSSDAIDEVENMGDKAKSNIDILNALNNKRWSLTRLNKHEEAVKCCNQFLAIKPGNETFMLDKGYSLKMCNRLDEALATYEEIIQNYEERRETSLKGLPYAKILSRAWSDKGWVLAAMGRGDETLACYEKALDAWAENKMALTNKGDVLRVMNRNEEALACYDKAIKINPNDANAWSDKGNIEIKLGRYIEAEESLDRALEIDEWHEEAFLNKAELKARQDNISGAKGILDMLLERDKTFSNAWDAKARLFKKLKKYDEALECSDMAIRYTSEDQTWSDSEGGYVGLWLNNKADILMGKAEDDTSNGVKILEEALEISNEAIKKTPKRGICHYTKGQILEKLGRNEEAKEYFEKAKERGYKSQKDD